MEANKFGQRWPLTTIDGQKIFVDALITGDKEAIELFFSEQGFSLLLWKLAHQCAAEIGSALSEAGDLYSEAARKLLEGEFAVLRAWRRKPTCRLNHWVSRVVLNHFKNIKRRRRLERLVHTVLPEGWTSVDPASHPLVSIVREALEELQPGEREVLELLLQGYDYQDIAAKLHLSAQVAATRRSRALASLRERLLKSHPHLFATSSAKKSLSKNQPLKCSLRGKGKMRKGERR